MEIIRYGRKIDFTYVQSFDRGPLIVSDGCYDSCYNSSAQHDWQSLFFDRAHGLNTDYFSIINGNRLKLGIIFVWK